MAFGILIVGMLMGLLASATVLPSDASVLTMALSYMVVGTLTFMSVVCFAMLGSDAEDAAETD